MTRVYVSCILKTEPDVGALNVDSTKLTAGNKLIKEQVSSYHSSG